MNLADLLAQALSVSPGYQRQADARTANSYESGAIPEMLAGMNMPQSIAPWAPQNPMNPMLPPGIPQAPGIQPSAPMMNPNFSALPPRAPIPTGRPR